MSDSEDTETGRIHTLDGLASELADLKDMVTRALSGAHTAAASHEREKLDRPTREAESTREHALSLKEEIQAELGRLREQEKAEKDRAELHAKVGKLEKAAERPPREYRRVERAMGWVRDGDT